MHPLYLMISTAVATSFAFCLPVATPPNAIVFTTGFVTIPDMVTAVLDFYPFSTMKIYEYYRYLLVLYIIYNLLQTAAVHWQSAKRSISLTGWFRG